MNQLLKEIPLLIDYKELRRIKKGVSADEKYFVSLHDPESKYLVRFFPINQYKDREKEFTLLKAIEAYETKAIKAIEIGKTLGYGYLITTFIEGNDVEQELGILTENEQYQLGFQSGEELLHLHSIQAPSNMGSWYDRKSLKHKKYVEAYKAGPIKIDQDEKILLFIEDHLSGMKINDIPIEDLLKAYEQVKVLK